MRVNKTGYRGVFKGFRQGEFLAILNVNGKNHSKSFTSKEDAAIYWDDIARSAGRQYFNFPKDGEKHISDQGRTVMDHREKIRHDKLRMGINTITETVEGKLVEISIVKCSCCKKQETKRFATYAQPTVISTIFRNSGWDVTRKGEWTCPACLKAKREKPQEPVNMSPAKPHAPIKPEAIAAVRAPTARETIAIADALAPLFDKGRYKAGHDDRSIGKALELPAAMVAKVREELHGPIKGDPEIDAIKSELSAIISMIKPLEQRIAATEKRICG